jgi:hypothetical protein
VNETNGSWAPFWYLYSANVVNSVSCSLPGYCAAGGYTGGYSAYVASERDGRWSRGIGPDGLPPESMIATGPGAQIGAVACPPGIDLCTAGGFYAGPKGGLNAFLVRQSA